MAFLTPKPDMGVARLALGLAEAERVWVRYISQYAGSRV